MGDTRGQEGDPGQTGHGQSHVTDEKLEQAGQIFHERPVQEDERARQHGREGGDPDEVRRSRRADHPGRRRPVRLRRHPRRRRQQLDGDASGAEVAAPAAGAATVAGRLAPLAPAICGDRVRAPAVQTAVPVRRPTSAR